MKMAGYGLPLFLRGIYNAVEESEEGCEFIEDQEFAAQSRIPVFLHLSYGRAVTLDKTAATGLEFTPG